MTQPYKEIFVILDGVAILYDLIKGIDGLVQPLVSGSGTANSIGSVTGVMALWPEVLHL